jgi:hypothetical protein
MRRTSSRKPRPADPPRRPAGAGTSDTINDGRSTPSPAFHHYEMEYDVSHGYSSDRAVIIR